jgi:hypothetical protein
MIRTLAHHLRTGVFRDNGRLPDASEQTVRQPVTQARIRQMYQRPESLTDLLPWTEYLPDTQTFVLEDGASVGAFFELQPIATDGHSSAFLKEVLMIAHMEPFHVHLKGAAL